MREDVKPDQVAVFIMSGYWGIRNIGKLHNSKSVYLIYLKQLKDHQEYASIIFFQKTYYLVCFFC